MPLTSSLSSFTSHLLPLIFCLLPYVLAAQPTTPGGGGTLVREQLSDLPTVYIDTEFGQGIFSKDVWINATYTEVVAGEVVHRYDNLQIRGRGNSTWDLEKKPYRLKFDSKVRLLGPTRASARDWVLMANHADKTLLRNATAAFVGRFLGQPFTPGERFVDVVLNNQYIGNYQITDQLDIRKHRIEIAEQDDEVDGSSNITGGYLVEFDGFWAKSDVSFHTSRGVPVTIHYPDDQHIVSSQIDYIQTVIQRFENALYSSDYTDPYKGYRALCDTTSLATLYVASEFVANPDAFWSTYAYKNAGDPLLYWGPLWDYDIAFNNCRRVGDVTHRALIDYAFGGQVLLPWMQRMNRDPWFTALIARTWREASAAGICDKTLAYVDSLAAVIESSQRLNFQRYSIRQRVYDEITVYSTYAEGIDYLKRFITEHAAFLDRIYPPISTETPDPEPQPNPDPGFDPELAYAIVNAGCGKRADQSSMNICLWDPDVSRLESQTWHLVPSTHAGYYYILAYDTPYAVSDAASATYNGYATGSTLELAFFDSSDARQEWRFVECNGHWVIENRLTSLAWNNSGGNIHDGNDIISWTNNEDNAFKLTRQWDVIDVTPLISQVSPPAFSSLASDTADYRVIFEPTTSQLVVIQPFGQHLPGTISVHSADGRLLTEGDIAVPLDLSRLSPGTYVATWNVGDHCRSAKIQL